MSDKLPTVSIVVVQYAEPGETERTLQSVSRIEYPLDVTLVPRPGGVGSLSFAFDLGMGHVPHSDYVWFLTNVGIKDPAGSVSRLVEFMQAHPFCAACHPVFNSDHWWQCPGRATDRPVTFIEWTAPFLRRRALDMAGLADLDLTHWGMDLDECGRFRVTGLSVRICPDVVLEHEYLRASNDAYAYAITQERRRVRAESDAKTEEHLIRKWGDDWLIRLWPEHPSVPSGKMRLYIKERVKDRVRANA